MEVLLFTTNQGKAEPAVYRVIDCLCPAQTAAAPVGAAVWSGSCVGLLEPAGNQHHQVVPQTAHQATLLHLFQGDQRYLLDLLVPLLEEHCADALTLGQRCLQFAFELEVRLEVVALATGDQHGDVLVDAQLHFRLVAHPDLLGHQLGARLVGCQALEEAETVGEQLLALGGAGGFAAGAQYHGDQTHAFVVGGGGDQVVADLADVTGFDAVNLQGLIPQQAVAVVLGDAVEHEGFLGVDLVLLRQVADQGLAQARHVVSGTVVTFRIQTVRVHEVAVVHAELGGPAVHQTGEGVGAARQEFGHGDAGVVAGLDDDALVQVIDGDLLAHLDEHLGGVGVVLGPGVLADGHHVGALDVPLQQLLADDVGGHHLGQTGGRQTLFGVLLGQYLTGVVVDQDVGLGRDLRRGGNHHGVGVRRRGRYRRVGLGGGAYQGGQNN